MSDQRPAAALFEALRRYVEASIGEALNLAGAPDLGDAERELMTVLDRVTFSDDELVAMLAAMMERP